MTKDVAGIRNYEYMAPPFDEDPDGEEALWEGGNYYNEAMTYTDQADRDKRVKCFQAAEQLYLQAAERGNAWANLNLGYVYSYDRSEGDYFRRTYEEKGKSYPREERAFECFRAAAEAGIPEACYKLGDLYKHGVGCEPDEDAAYRWYFRASELVTHSEEPVILGSIALRLANCFEEGFGCEQSFSCALQMYRHAVAALEAAIDSGETWYEKALAGARAGVKRCQQEVALY